ncbi:transmembrane protein 145-like isoform X2 [Acropora millepora]|uniref:transmembrane protein 145-like isoform X2 n=1 Tax=Acropora millepora TaxID=45264 RepID=UPI001CF45210|nr:transmembrane protein 145-like isoform X2 [Acropora millepora]
MAADRRILVLILWFSVFYVKNASTKIVEGTLSTKEDWVFLARFCYKDSIGQLKYHFEYPLEYATQNIILYFDTQWPNVYPQEGMKCIDKEDKVHRGNNQIINLTSSYIWAGCVQQDILGKSHFICKGDRNFRSNRERWWYIVLSNCESTKGLQVKYRLEMTNGENAWGKQFSADERYILPMDIGFFVLFIIVWVLSMYVAKLLASRRLFHVSYKLFMASVTFEVLSLMFSLIYYDQLGKTGFETYELKIVARASHYISHVVFLIMLILMAKGWTVTRGRISSSGQIKLSIFGTVYSVCFAVLFFYEAAVFDPGEVLYIYESAAGVGICVLRVIAWLWFCYGTFFTLKHFPNKCNFYYPFWFFYTGWFLAGPLVVAIATFKIPKWERAQVVNGLEWCISILAHCAFLLITRPSAANTNFPFHMRTNQIGILEAAPSRQEDIGGAYYMRPTRDEPPPYYTQGDGRFADITSMFLANGVKSTQTAVNGVQNGIFNGPMTSQNGQAVPPSR